MSGALGAVFAILATWLGGSLLVAGLLPAALRGRPGFWSTAAAVGFMTGAGLVGLIMMVAAGSELDYLWVLAGLFLAAAGGLARRPWRSQEDLDDHGRRRLVTLLVLLALPTLTLSVIELLQRPLLGWDAWTVWSVKPRAWFGAGSGIDFVAFPAWLAGSDPLVHATPASHYPELIGRYVLWQARWVGAWNEQLVHLPWVAVWLSLMAGSYGLMRLAGRTAGYAGLVTALLVVTPFIAVHMALPGYMDLWIAAELLLACGLFVLWLDRRQPGLLALAFLLLAMLVGTKVEGLIWAAIIVVAAVFAALPRRPAIGSLAVLVALGLAWWAAGGVDLSIAGRSWIFSPTLIDLPYLGRYELAFSNRLAPFGQALFVLPNWHLLAVLTALGAVGGLMLDPGRRHYRFCYAVLGLGSAFLFVLFNFTPAGIWAENLTASNRLTLHLLPAAFWLIMYHLESALGRSRASTEA